MRCLIADNSISLTGLASIISSNFPDWEILLARTVNEAIDCMRVTEDALISLVLVDLIKQDQGAFRLLEYISKRIGKQGPFPPISTIVISEADDRNTIASCKARGAQGFVSKSGDIANLVLAVRTVISGYQFFPDDEAHTDGFHMLRLPRMTERQQDLLDLVLAGYSNKQIAATLGLSYGTVKNYMYDLMRLMGVVSRLEMALKSREDGYVPRRLWARRYSS
jgi:two-component system nitrate/nitrite response regulator NarL